MIQPTLALSLPVTVTAIDIMGILPHRAPFLMIREAVVDPETRSGVAKITVPSALLWNDFPGTSGRAKGQELLRECLLEAVAQSAGVVQTILSDDSTEDSPKNLLASFRSVEFHSNGSAKKSFDVEIRSVLSMGSLARLSFAISQDGVSVGRGEVTVA